MVLAGGAGRGALGALGADEQEEMDEAVAMLTEAVAQGHGGAAELLAEATLKHSTAEMHLELTLFNSV